MPAVTVMIKPASSLCNMRCGYCFYADEAENRSTKSYGVMSESTLEAVVRETYRYAEGSVSFVFQGGEPTLAGLPFFENFVRLVGRYNVGNVKTFFSVQTNGLSLGEDFVAFFRRNNFLVGVSLDATKELHDTLRKDTSGDGTYDRVLRTLNALGKAGVDTNILCVVNNFTAGHPRRVFTALKRYGYLQFIPCIDPFDGEKSAFSLTEKRYARFLSETFDAYYECFEKGSPVSVRNFDNYISILLGAQPENCAMAGRCTAYFVIEGDGGVYPCDFYVLDRYRLGNVNTDYFADMANGETVRAFRAESEYTDEKCRACKWYFLCRGGCRRDREPFSDGHPSLCRYCGSMKTFFENSFEKMNKMAEKIRYLRSAKMK